MRNEADAREAVEECFLLGMCSFREALESPRGGSMRAWLLAILRTVCRDELVRRARGRQPIESADNDDDAQGASDEALAVRRAVGELSAPLQEVLVLRDGSRLSYAEIALICEATAGVVMERLMRARGAMRAALGPELGATSRPGTVVPIHCAAWPS